MVAVFLCKIKLNVGVAGDALPGFIPKHLSAGAIANFGQLREAVEIYPQYSNLAAIVDLTEDLVKHAVFA
jgi:hypothetical protein